MSERAPSPSNPIEERLSNLDEVVDARDRKRYYEELMGDAGTAESDATKEDQERRLNEALEYDRHMEMLSGETRTDVERGQDRLDSQETPARVDPLLEEAYAMNEEFDEAKVTEANAIKEKIENSPRLRRMDMLASEVDALRAKMEEGEAEEIDLQRLEDKENKLNELLAAYEEADDFDPKIADELIDRSDRREEREARRKEGKTSKTSIDLPDDVDTTRFADTKDGLGLPEEVNTTRFTDVADLGLPADVDTTRFGELPPPAATMPKRIILPPEVYNPTPTPAEKRNAVLRFFDRMRGKGEHADPTEKKKMVKIALGAAALVTLTVVGAIVNSKGGDGQQVVDGAMNARGMWGGVGDWLRNTAEGMQGNGPDTITPTGPETLPVSSGFDYPWNWASEAVGKENATEWLHTLSEKAAEAGHQVEWHGSGAREWVEVDGNSNPKAVIDVLRQYAK